MPIVCFGILAAWSAPVEAETPTFSEHIAPIIFNNCVTCHRSGAVAPFSLTNYREVTSHGRAIAARTATRYMPPWKAVPGYAEYRGERRLSNEQIRLIREWVDAGMPEGDPSKLPPLPEFPTGWRLGQPDLIVEMPETFDVPADGPDVYRNFVIPLNLSEDKWVSVVELRAAAKSVLHHALFFTDGTGSARSADAVDPLPGFPGLLPVGTNLSLTDVVGIVSGAGPVGLLGGWVPGTNPAPLPQGLAMRLPKGADFVLQAHFHLNGQRQREKTAVGLYFASKAPERTLVTLQVPALFGALSGIDIPAGAKSYLVRDSFVLPIDVEAIDVQAHAHYLARDMKLTATLPSGEVRVLLWINDWDLDWQDRYFFRNLVSLPKGTRLDGEIRYDNSLDNPNNPHNPPVRVTWGPQSTDEMGSLILTVVPSRQAELPALRDALVQQLAQTVRKTQSRDPAQPNLISSGVVDAASGRFGPLTPGKIVILYGSNLGPRELARTTLTDDSRSATELGGVRVLINGTAAPLLYAASGQASAVVPYSLAGRQGAQVVVEYDGRRSEPIAFPVAEVAPSLFTADFSGRGQAVALNDDGLTVNSATSPVAKGSAITLYATGAGQTEPVGIDGTFASNPVAKPCKPVTARIAERPAEVLSAGAAPGLVAGVMRVNIRIPADLPSGNVPVRIFVGEAGSQEDVTVAVR